MCSLMRRTVAPPGRNGENGDFLRHASLNEHTGRPFEPGAIRYENTSDTRRKNDFSDSSSGG